MAESEMWRELHYWWRAWRLRNCGNWTIREIRDALKKYDASLSPSPAGEGR